MKIADLSDPVAAAKVDWTPQQGNMGFTAHGSIHKCESSVQQYAGRGWVLESITNTSPPKPNPGTEDDEYRAGVKQHRPLAGRLVAIHRLHHRYTPRSVLMGAKRYERHLRMWGDRWSVTFSIIASYEIEDPPVAREIFGRERCKRLLENQGSHLRELTDADRAALAHLKIVPRPILLDENNWQTIEQEAEWAAHSDVDPRIRACIEEDLAPLKASEGESERRLVWIRQRAAWLAQKFITQRQRNNKMHCDDCVRATLERYPDIRPRALLQAHHKQPLAEGKRITTIDDYTLLCLPCHKAWHERNPNGGSIQ